MDFEKKNSHQATIYYYEQGIDQENTTLTVSNTT